MPPTKSSASWRQCRSPHKVVGAMMAVCICCSGNSRFCTLMSSFVSVGKYSRSIVVVVIYVGCSATHSNIISDLLVTPAKNCLRLLRPLLEILFSASELLRTTEPFHIDETRSVLPNLSCREIVDCSHCIGKFRFCFHLSSQSEQLLLKLRHDLLHRHRHRYSSEFRKFVQQAIAATPQVNTFQRIPGDSSCHVKLSTTLLLLRFTALKPEEPPGSCKQSRPENTTPQLSAHRQLSTRQKNK